MVGRAICRALDEAGFANITGQTHAELDLREKDATESYLKAEQPDVIIIAAAKVGGRRHPRPPQCSHAHDSAGVVHAGAKIAPSPKRRDGTNWYTALAE